MSPSSLDHQVQDLGVLGEHDVRSDVVVQAGKGKGPAQAARRGFLFEQLDGLDVLAILQEGGQRDAGQPAAENGDPHLHIPEKTFLHYNPRKGVGQPADGVSSLTVPPTAR